MKNLLVIAMIIFGLSVIGFVFYLDFAGGMFTTIIAFICAMAYREDDSTTAKG